MSLSAKLSDGGSTQSSKLRRGSSQGSTFLIGAARRGAARRGAARREAGEGGWRRFGRRPLAGDTGGLRNLLAFSDFPMTPSRARALCAASRKRMGIAALSGVEPVARLARRHGTSRKFVRAQRERARQAVNVAFAVPPAAPLAETFPCVSDAWVRRFALAVILIVHGSYRHVVELLRDLFGLSLSIGTIHAWVEQAAQRAGAINRAQDLSGVRVGLHDEIFQGEQPVLAGIDAASTYCYLLQGVEQRDADTWGVHLLDAAKQGLDPEYTVADAGAGLRAGQAAAWGDKPCHGDVFHVRKQCEAVSNVLARLVKGNTSRREALELEMDAAKVGGAGRRLSARLGRARQAEVQARQLAADVKTLTGWLGHDVLSLAGPNVEERRELFDFIIEQLRLREALAPHRIRPLRVALQRQRDDVLGFAKILDGKLAAIAQQHGIPQYWVRQVCRLHRKKPTSAAFWQRWNELHARLGHRFVALVADVCAAMDDTPRSSSMVENLNSRLRRYFFLRRHLGDAYLSLLQFFLNHRVFMRSRRAERVGKPKQLLTGQAHAHWLELPGFERLVPA
jgi:hypothetical protein